LKVEGIVFDMDGTLANLGGFVDWGSAYHRAKGAYLQFGCPPEMIEGLGESNLFNLMNRVRDENVRSMTEEAVCNIQGIVHAEVEACEFEGVEYCGLMPGCLDALDWIRDRGIVMGVATSNSELVTERVLGFLGVRDYFDTIVGRRPELRMKPYPDQILVCLDEIGVDFSRGLMVGDSVKDVEAAIRAKVPVVAVPSYFTNQKAVERLDANLIIGDLGELPAAILELTGSNEIIGCADIVNPGEDNESYEESF
jgi:phosphoglycolate phosphatase-like HAD superfamily hydrolase